MNRNRQLLYRTLEEALGPTGFVLTFMHTTVSDHAHIAGCILVVCHPQPFHISRPQLTQICLIDYLHTFYTIHSYFLVEQYIRFSLGLGFKSAWSYKLFCLNNANVCFKKIWTNYSIVSLLWFVQIFLQQMLFVIQSHMAKQVLNFINSSIGIAENLIRSRS